MAKLLLFSVHDSKVGSYLPPITLRSAGEAIRSFETSANNADNNIGKYPADFTLFEIGSFDDSTGEISLHSAHVSLGKALDYIKN